MLTRRKLIGTVAVAAAGIAATSEADFAAFRARTLASRLRCKSFNSFIHTLRVVGEEADREALHRFLDLGPPRRRALGGEIVVWGSAGEPRILPPRARRLNERSAAGAGGRS